MPDTYWNRAMETRPREEREAEVLERVKDQLRFVYSELPFYRRHYDEHAFHPSQVQKLEDFTRLVPVINKAMLRDDQAAHPPHGTYAGLTAAEAVRIHGSSGTTGAPTLYAFSKEDWNHIAEVMAQGFYTCGVRPDDIVQLATVFSLFMGGWGALLATERIGAAAFPIGAGETERQLELMQRLSVTVLVTTPTYALHMLETARRLGYNTAGSSLRLGIFIGEPGAGIPGTRRALQEGWGIEVRDCATTSEMTPWATNAECEAGQGVHVLQDQVWTEIVDKSDPSRKKEDGASGVVVYTHLHRRSQPMIRFWSGDESHMVHDPCPCGRTYPRLPDGVYGRVDDMMLIRGANVYPSQVQRSLLEVPGIGVEFSLVLDRDGAMDVATVRAEYDADAPGAGDEAFRAELVERVRRKLKNDTSINFVVELLEPETLPRALSKAQRVIDNRPPIRPAGVA
jgi:phenylacetate-CoA ligase